VGRVASRRVLFGLLAVAGVALISAGVVLAGNPAKEKIALTKAGNKRARAEVLHRADVGAGWSGGLRKPHLPATLPCSYRPKQSDLVVVGASESIWQKPGVVLDSGAQVLRNAAMVRKDWRRTVLAPQVPACLRRGFVKSLGSSAKLVSFDRASFPPVAPRTRAFRAVADVKSSLGTVRVDIDFVAFGVGRNELNLTISGPTQARSSLARIEKHWARVLVGRARSGA
jgi:hypothetical protein